MAGIILDTGAVAVQSGFGEGICPRAGTRFWAHVQCRVTRRDRSQKTVKLQDFKWVQGAYPGTACDRNLSCASRA